jgi:hypothetical protein
LTLRKWGNIRGIKIRFRIETEGQKPAAPQCGGLFFSARERVIQILNNCYSKPKAALFAAAR